MYYLEIKFIQLEREALILNKKSENVLSWKATFVELYNRNKRLKVPEKISIPTDILLTYQKN